MKLSEIHEMPQVQFVGGPRDGKVAFVSWQAVRRMLVDGRLRARHSTGQAVHSYESDEVKQGMVRIHLRHAGATSVQSLH